MLLPRKSGPDDLEVPSNPVFLILRISSPLLTFGTAVLFSSALDSLLYKTQCKIIDDRCVGQKINIHTQKS